MDTNPSKLRFTEGTIHFIYSFLLNLYPDPDQFYESTHGPLLDDSPLDRLKPKLSAKGDNKKWLRDKPIERIGVTTNLDIDGKRKSLYFKKKTNGEFRLVPYANGDSVKDKANISLSLDMLIRINDNGSSTCTLSVAFKANERPLSAVAVHNIFNLVPINREQEPLYALCSSKSGKDEKKTLFSYFLEQLGCHVISKLQYEGEINHKHGIWLDSIAVPSCKNNDAKDWQNPFTIAQLVLDEDYEDGKAIWSGDLARYRETETDILILRKKEELFTIYTRMLKGKHAIEKDRAIHVPRKLLDNGKYGLHSFSWHDDRRGMLVVH
jgi:hypothetical protein